MAADGPAGAGSAHVARAPDVTSRPATWSVERAAVSASGARSRNEDRLAERRCADGRHHAFVLADGAGGHADGAIAAELAVVAALEAIDAVRVASPGIGPLAARDARAEPARLADAVRRAHAAVAAAQRERAVPQDVDEQLATMHTTLVLLVVDLLQGTATWAHVGDSRLYRLRAAGAEALTRDDTLAQRLADAGTPLPPGTAARTPLLAALGGSTPPEPHVPPRPVALHDGDVYLLCSDGWWDALGADDIGPAPARDQPLADWLAQRAAQVVARAVPRQDNYSALACRLRAPTVEGDLPTLAVPLPPAGPDDELPTLPGR